MGYHRSTRRTVAAANNGIVTKDLLADYWFAEAAGTIINDYSGQGNDGTLGAASAAPVWSGGGATFNGNQYITIPSGLLPNIRTVTLLSSAASAPSYMWVLGSSDAAGIGWILESNIPNNNKLPGPSNATNNGGGGALSYSFQLPGLPTLMAWTQSGSIDCMYCNGVQCQYANGQSNYATTGRAGSLTIGYSSQKASLGFKGTMYRLMLHGRDLQPAENWQNYVACQNFAVLRGKPLNQRNSSSQRQLITDGDSITYGLMSSAPWPQNMTLTQSFQRWNVGIPGQRAANMAARSLQNYGQLIAPSAAQNIVTVMPGTNDLNDGVAAATVFDYTLALVTQYLAAGASGIVVIPVIDRLNQAGPNATYNALVWGYSWPAHVSVIPRGDTNMGNGAGSPFDWFATGTAIYTITPPTSGTFSITYNSVTTGAINWNETAVNIQADLQLLSSIGSGNCTVTGGSGAPIVVTLTGATITQSQNPITATGSLGVVNNSTGCANGVYYNTDRTHPTTAGDNLLGPAVEPYVNAFG